MSSKHKYETRLNGRGGWEAGIIGDRPGNGEGNYATEADAYAYVRRNYEPTEIKRGEEPTVMPAPKPARKSAPQPSAAGRLLRRVKALTK
ncbi:MAG: hypothetical protein WC205_16780 [Opitutaceae bacterium]|jgi:hypothetical protein